MRTTETQIDNSLSTERMIASLSAVFGLLATLLAVIGLYGVMAYAVAQRTREIGIRMALGAARDNVIWMVMREVLVLVAIGVVAGIVASIGLTRVVQSQLFGLTPHDPLTVGLATAALAAVAIAAGYIPAVRASRLDPMSGPAIRISGRLFNSDKQVSCGSKRTRFLEQHCSNLQLRDVFRPRRRLRG